MYKLLASIYTDLSAYPLVIKIFFAVTIFHTYFAQ